MLIFNGVIGECRISSWPGLIRDLLDTALLFKKKIKKCCFSTSLHREVPPKSTASAGPRVICMRPLQVDEEYAWRKRGGLLFDMCIMYSHASRSRQAGCISCSTWMNSAAEHAQVMLSKGQFELSQTGVEPLIGMLSRFHFSRALFWFTTAVLSLFLSHPLPFSASLCCLSDFLCSKLSSSREEKQLGDW